MTRITCGCGQPLGMWLDENRLVVAYRGREVSVEGVFTAVTFKCEQCRQREDGLLHRAVGAQSVMAGV